MLCLDYFYCESIRWYVLKMLTLTPWCPIPTKIIFQITGNHWNTLGGSLPELCDIARNWKLEVCTMNVTEKSSVHDLFSWKMVWEFPMIKADSSDQWRQHWQISCDLPGIIKLPSLNLTWHLKRWHLKQQEGLRCSFSVGDSPVLMIPLLLAKEPKNGFKQKLMLSKQITIG